MRQKGVLFCLILALLWIPAICILIQFSNFLGLAEDVPGKFFALTVAAFAPAVAKDASLFGELTPVAVAGALVFLAPEKTQRELTYVAVAICAIGWALYLVLSVLLDQPGQFQVDFITRTEGEITPDGIKALKGFLTGARVFYLVAGATLLGFQVRKDAA